MDLSRGKHILIHIIAWVSYVLLYAALWRGDSITFVEALVRQAWLLPPKLLLVYTAIGLLVPAFLRTRRYGLFFLTLVALSLTGALINQALVHFVIPLSTGIKDEGERFWDLGRMSKRLTYINSPLLFALCAEGIRMWYEQREINARLTREKLSAELALMKSQLQPHFFFNTMNNLYSLTLQKSDLAPTLILRLSALMRYILTDSRKDLVALEDEIKFISEYIDIEQVRYAGKVTVTTSWPEHTGQFQVPPLILFTFIENAFKHGVANEVGIASINIRLEMVAKGIVYTVQNSCPEMMNGQVPEKSSGTGLRNTKERMKITYGPNCSFMADRAGNSFHASLTISALHV